MRPLRSILLALAMMTSGSMISTAFADVAPTPDVKPEVKKDIVEIKADRKEIRAETSKRSVLIVKCCAQIASSSRLTRRLATPLRSLLMKQS